MNSRRPLLLVVLLMPVAACAQPAGGAALVRDAWVRLNPPGTTATAAYMTIRNPGGRTLRIVQAECPAARAAEFHEHRNDGGVLRMRAVPALSVEGRGETVLRPGGLHLMLIDLKARLRAGDRVPLILRFEDGTSVMVRALVKKQIP